MRRAAPPIALLALALALVLAPSAAAAIQPGNLGPSSAPAPSGPDSAADRPRLSAPSGPDSAADRPRLSAPANTTIEIVVRPNRSARWHVTVTYALDSPNETATFRGYAEAYRNGETDAGPTIDLFRRIVDASSAATGREMTVRDVSRDATVRETNGSVTLSFLWTGMLERTDNRTIRLDDAVLIPGNRTWISTLEANQTLVVRTPDGYSVVDSDVPSFELRNNAVVVSGPARIDGNLQITYRQTGSVGPDQGLPWGLVAAAVLVAAGALGVVLYLYPYRRDRHEPSPDTGSAVGDGAPSTGEAAGTTTHDADGTEPSASPDDSGGTETESPADSELISDEERVERLLRANDGRMKQATIVRETGWSDAKVSQLLSAMADEGRVDKLRLGRENLISLPDEDEGTGRD